MDTTVYSSPSGSLPYWPDNWPVTLQFVAGVKAHDKLIQFYSHGWPTHVDVVWPPNIPGGPERLFGARWDYGHCVAIRALGYEKFVKVARITLPMTNEQKVKFFAFCKQQMGKPYDDIDIVSLAIPAIRRIWRDNPDAWYCSELTEAAIEETGFWRPIATATNMVTPTLQFNIASAFAEVVYVTG